MVRGLLLVLICALLVACGPGGRDQTDTGVVTRREFADARPHPWTGRTPDSYPVHGVDVSRFQPAVNWPEARRSGVNFAFIKATEGGDLLDPMFKEHWRGAGRAGVARGAYHFYYHCRPAIEQARWFMKHVPRTAGALPPVLDMEWTPFSPTCTIRRDGVTIRAEAKAYLAAVRAHYGQRPIVYTSIDFFEDNELWKIDGADFWLRAVAAHPSDAYAGHPWTFWQHTSTGLVPGIMGEVDINAFAGGAAAWQAWRGARAR